LVLWPNPLAIIYFQFKLTLNFFKKNDSSQFLSENDYDHADKDKYDLNFIKYPLKLMLVDDDIFAMDGAKIVLKNFNNILISTAFNGRELC